MKQIPQDTIDQIRDSSEILDIISDYVELRQRGRNYFGLCPFHPEKTPSFSVAPDKQIYHCFGCGAGGNSISFLMEYEKISFVDSLKTLAARYGVELNVNRDEGSDKFFSQLYDVHNQAVSFFKNNLDSTHGKKVLKYLQSRGLDSNTIESFDIGYAGDGWDHLLSVIRNKKISQDVIEKCGLFTKTDKGIFDRFRNRLMFPISNRGDRIVGFGGRDMSGENDAKYLNSPETPIYNKREILYGLSRTRSEAREKRSFIVVEGYMDFLQLYQNGIKNVVATSGTALTSAQVSQLRKLADTVYLCYDGDIAGRKATIAAGYNLMRGGINVKIVIVPEGSDPDSWVKEFGAHDFKKGLKDAKDLITFHFENTLFDITDATQQSKLANEIAHELTTINDDIIRRELVRQVAEKLSVDEISIMRLIESKGRRINQKQIIDVKNENYQSSLYKAEEEIVKLLASGNIDIFELLKDKVNTTFFSNPTMKVLADYLIKSDSSNGFTNVSGAVDIFEEKYEREIASRLLLEAVEIEDPYHVAIDCLITIEKQPLKKKIEQERIRLRQIEKSGKDTSETIASIMKLRENLSELEKKRVSLLKSLK
ncbi:MAG: DNA primase [Candidatus Marinimicrobia bacterium]|nr:DNA primase [Candidatus Neomarinimicrobiota bacterium]